MPPSRPWSGYIRELDGVRALAVFLVFLNHFAPVASSPQTLILRQIGWIGVDVFFVLSGFLITGILLDSKSRPRYYLDFYIRRSLRIFPLYYTLLSVLLLWMLFRKDGIHYDALVAEWGSPAWLFLYLGNIKTAISGIVPPSSFVPLWSLHVEEQFYLIFPFIVRRMSQEKLLKTLLAVVVLAPVFRLAIWWWDPTQPLMQYVLLPCRMDGLGFGALIALRLRMGPWQVPRLKLGAAAWALFAAACAGFVIGGRSYDSPFVRTIGYSLFAASFACGILWIILFRGSAATNWLNAGPIQFIGKISYGIYLFQAPAGTFLSYGSDVSMSKFVMLWLAVVTLATGSWYLLEKPLLSLKSVLTRGTPTPVPLRPEVVYITE